MRNHPNQHFQSGMTLVEVMVAFSLFTIIMGALFLISLGFGDVAELQRSKATNMDNCRMSLYQIMWDIRQASRQSINFAELPGTRITYRIPSDLDGNGTSVDQNGRIELGGVRTIMLDVDDMNGDGITTSQLLLLIDGEIAAYLANNLNPDQETTDDQGVFGPSNDLDGDGMLDRGFWITPENGGLTFEIQGMQEDRRGRQFVDALTAFVIPRN